MTEEELRASHAELLKALIWAANWLSITDNPWSTMRGHMADAIRTAIHNAGGTLETPNARSKANPD